MVYMDDSLWVAQSKKELEDIIAVANSFYKFMGIQVNPTKSILVTNSSMMDKSINFNRQQIIAIAPTQPFKYLGARFSIDPGCSKVQKTIMREARQSIAKIHKVYITEKQTIYIINSVIISRLSYRLYSAFLTPKQLEQLTHEYTGLVKNKAKISRNIPNSFLYHQDIYTLKYLPQIQQSHLSSTIVKNINHIDFDRSFFKIYLQELQDSTQSDKSILHSLPLFPRKQLKTYTSQMILALHSLDIQVFRNEHNEWPIPRKNNCGTLINNILLQHPKAHILKEKLNLHEVVYVEQFLNYNNSRFLDWRGF